MKRIGLFIGLVALISLGWLAIAACAAIAQQMTTNEIVTIESQKIYDQGYDDGRADGYDDGFSRGYRHALEEVAAAK